MRDALVRGIKFGFDTWPRWAKKEWILKWRLGDSKWRCDERGEKAAKNFCCLIVKS